MKYDDSELENKRITVDAFKHNPYMYVLRSFIEAFGIAVVICLMAQCTCNGCIY